jgi:hypothetical protein
MSEQASSCVDIADWRPEDAHFWETQGKRIAVPQPVDIHPNLLVRLCRLGHVGHHHRADAQFGLPIQTSR